MLDVTGTRTMSATALECLECLECYNRRHGSIVAGLKESSRLMTSRRRPGICFSGPCPCSNCCYRCEQQPTWIWSWSWSWSPCTPRIWSDLWLPLSALLFPRGLVLRGTYLGTPMIGMYFCFHRRRSWNGSRTSSWRSGIPALSLSR